MKNLKWITLISMVLMTARFGVSQARAAYAYDDASDPAAYADGWQSGDNGGIGFGPWTLTTTSGAHLIGTSENNDAGNIDVGGNSFGLQNTDAFDFTDAARAISTPMLVGEIFKVSIDAGPLASGGTVSFSLKIGANPATILSYSSGAGNYIVSDGGGPLNTGIAGGTDLLVQYLITGANTYDVNINGTDFLSRTFIGSGAIDNLRFLNIANDGFPGEDFYFNGLEVVPEPAVTGGLACLVLLGAVMARSRWVGLRVKN